MKYLDIERYYEGVRARHENRRKECLERALKNPRFAVLWKERNSLLLTMYRARFDEDEENASLLCKEIEGLTAQIEGILSDMGMTEEDLRPSYDCPVCKDTGYVMEKPCACFEQARKNVLKAEGVTKDFLPFYPPENIPNERLKRVAESVQNYAQRFPETAVKTLVLQGKTGTGKTRLMQAYLKTAEEKGYSVLYFTAAELVNEFLGYHTGRFSERGVTMERLLYCDLLAIDDLGTEPLLKNVTKEYLLSVISTRAIRKKHTVITTNLSPSDVLSRYEERVFSRLAENGVSKWISFKDIPDLRLGDR